jgi:hypothetical protein
MSRAWNSFAIQIVGLRGKFDGLHHVRVIVDAGGVGGEHDDASGIESRVYALEVRHRQHDVLGGPRQGDGVGDGELDALDVRRGVQHRVQCREKGRGGQGENERTASELHLVV